MPETLLEKQSPQAAAAAAKLRAWWSHRQGLDGSLTGQSPAAVLRNAGWARSVAGVGPYLTLFSRAGTRREQIDAALANCEIHELPAARGCTYVLPAADFALGLSAGQSFALTEMKVAYKLGVTDDEISVLRAAVTNALAREPLQPDALKPALGDAVRSLGPEGVKKGITTTLPLALGVMQADGEIRRIPVNGRLDQQRYKYALWKPNPFTGWKLDTDQTFTELARHYFRWTGPATLAEFQWFSGLSLKAVKAAVAPLSLSPAGDPEDQRWLLPEDRAAFDAFVQPADPQYSLVSSLDGISALRRDAKSLLTHKDQSLDFARAASGLMDLPHHAILDRGRLIGLWEYDTATESIAYACWVPLDSALRDAIARTETFIREDLGDARSFSLDTPKSRAPKIEALRRFSKVSK